MVNIGVCIETFFGDLDYEERLKKIYELGFKNYEFWFTDKKFNGLSLSNENKDLDRFTLINKTYGMTCTDFVFNHPDGGVLASLIKKEDQTLLLNSINRFIEMAKKIRCKGLIVTSGNKVKGLSDEEAVLNMIESLKKLAPSFENAGITLFLELFNTKVDHPDYFLDDPQRCIDVIKAVDSPKVKMLFDIYHVQIMSGNIIDFVHKNIQYIGHFHIAGVPGRHEPDSCELNYKYIIEEINKLPYRGNIGLEYWPSVDSFESLKRIKNYFGGLI